MKAIKKILIGLVLILAVAAVTSLCAFALETATDDAITADGYSIRRNNDNAVVTGPALRAEFTLLKSKVDEVETNEGLTLADFGVVVFSTEIFEQVYDGDEQAVFDAIIAGDHGTKIKVISAKGGSYLRANAAGDLTFAAAVVNIPEKNYTSAVYTYAYAKWTDGENSRYTFTTYTSQRTGKTAHSLYDTTVFALRNGIVNSQNTDADKLWPVLEKGALSVSESETKPVSSLLSLNVQYSFDDDGKFTYFDLPLRAWNMYKNASGYTTPDSRGVGVEEESTTNVLWSILTDGNELVAVYRADPLAEGNAILPSLNASAGACAPFSGFYFAPAGSGYVTEDPAANGIYKYGKIYSPIVSDDNAAKIKALVVDYGVDEFAAQSFDDSNKSNRIKDIVYPQGIEADAYLFAGCSYLENFIYATDDKSYLKGYSVESLADLSGLENVGLMGIAQKATSLVNLLLPGPDKIAHSYEYGFGGARALSRVWTVGYNMPQSGTLDLSNTKIETICRGFFNELDGIDEIIMPESFEKINSYSMATTGYGSDSARWYIFGDNSASTKLNIHVTNWNALNVIANTFYNAHQIAAHNDGSDKAKHIVDYLQITYEGKTKTVLEWRADFPVEPIPSEFITFDIQDAAFSYEENVLVIDGAVSGPRGYAAPVKISKIYNGSGSGVHTFESLEYEAFCDTIEVLNEDPDLNDYGLFFNAAQREAIMAKPEYKEQFLRNVLEILNGTTDTTVPKLYAVTDRDDAGNLILTDVDYDGTALVSPASDPQTNALTTRAGKILFQSGVATGATDGQFCTSSRNTAYVSAEKNMAMTDDAVFMIVAADGIYTCSGKPADGSYLDLTASTYIAFANKSSVMIIDRTRSINAITNMFYVYTGRYMLTSTTELRDGAEFVQVFNGQCNPCINSDYVAFTALGDDATFETDVYGNFEIHVLASDLARCIGTDVTKKLGYVYQLTIVNGQLFRAKEFKGDTYVDYGVEKDMIGVDDNGFLVVNGQKYDQILLGHANDDVRPENLGVAGVYDLRLFEYNPNAMHDGIAFNRRHDITDLKDNMFQEVTLFDTNKDGKYDYGIYMPYYIGNYITATVKDYFGNRNTHFVMPGDSVDCPYDFQYSGYLSTAKCTANTVLSGWDFSQKMIAYSNINIYKVNPASKDIIIVESVSRVTNTGKLSKLAKNSATGKIKSATVGEKDYKNIDILTDANLYGLSGYLAFEQMERMPTALRTSPIIGNWGSVFMITLTNSSTYGDMTVYELGGITIYAWPSIVRNYNFVTFDWTDAFFSLDGDVLVVDHALTDASGEYKTVRISTIYNGYGEGIHKFDGFEHEVFCDTIDVIYGGDAGIIQYNMYFNETQRAAVMSTSIYAQQLRLNILEKINGASGDITPMLYAVTGVDENGDLILTDFDFDNTALSSPAATLTDSTKKLTTVAGTMTFPNGVVVIDAENGYGTTYDDKFCTSSRNTAVVSTAKNLVMTASTVFTVVAADGIYTYTGVPENAYSMVLTANTFLVAANTSQVMIIDRTRCVNEILIGNVEYLGKFLDENNYWVNHMISDTWAFDENTNNCPQGFKWLVDNAYLVTDKTSLDSVETDENNVACYTYSNLYDIMAGEYVKNTFRFGFKLTQGNVFVIDRVLGYVETTLDSIFNVDNADFLNGANWATDTYVGRLVSGTTVAYYDFAMGGRFVGVTPDLVIITTGTQTTVSTNIADLKAGAVVYYTLVDGVPTGYAIQSLS